MNKEQNDIAIRVENLSKCYQIYDTPRDRLKQFILPRVHHLTGQIPRQYFREFWALKDVSFEVKKGETIGIIGRNGSGKSTLLQLICGTLSPTSGSITTHGRIAALLELGSGFNPEFTGRENVYMNASVLGLSKEEIDQCFDDIVMFADIGGFIEQPVKVYSSGMYARLAFAVAVNVEPEILVVDETLAVGDILFQAKAIQRMRELMDRCTVLFVSHSLATVKSFCNRAILVDQGCAIRDDRAPDVCDFYEMMMQKHLLASTRLSDVQALSAVDEVVGGNVVTVDPDFPESSNEFRSGSGALRVVRGDFLVNGHVSSLASFHDQLRLHLVVEAMQDVRAGAVVGYMVRDANAVDIFGRNLYNEKLSLPAMKVGQKVKVEFLFLCLLAQGRYSISIGVKSEPYLPEYYDVIHVARTFEVSNIQGNYVPGLMYVENKIEVTLVEENV